MELKSLAVRRPSSRSSTLVADRAVLRFEVVERHFEHVIASNAHAVNFRLRLAVAVFFSVLVGGVGLAHSWILSRLTRPGAPDSEIACVGIP